MGTFGKRYCVQCSKDFEAETRTQLCCSGECEMERQRLLKKESNKRHREKNKERLHLMSVVIQTQSSRISELENELKAVMQELAELKNGANEESGLKLTPPEIPELSNLTLPDTLDFLQNEAETDPQIITVEPVIQEKQITEDGTGIDINKMEYCERFKCRAMKLPCGQRQDCWEPSACHKTQGMTKPESFSTRKYDKHADAKSVDVDTLPDVSYDGV